MGRPSLPSTRVGSLVLDWHLAESPQPHTQSFDLLWVQLRDSAGLLFIVNAIEPNTMHVFQIAGNSTVSSPRQPLYSCIMLEIVCQIEVGANHPWSSLSNRRDRGQTNRSSISSECLMRTCNNLR